MASTEVLPTELYPEIKPRNEGFLECGQHQVWFAEYGNPNGVPVVFLHGGPGAGSNPHSARWFNPDLYRIFVLDQRGCGKSRPLGSIVSNTTQDIVGDLLALLDMHDIEKVILFGGSWGSTLALRFAIYQTHRVRGMILRGIYLGTSEENHYMYGGPQSGTRHYFPEAWTRYMSHVPEYRQDNPMLFYYEMLQHKVSTVRQWYASELYRFEAVISTLSPKTGEQLDSEMMLACPEHELVKAHFMTNNCFLPDGCIMQRIDRARAIPTIIINGRFDIPCRPSIAYALHKKLRCSRFFTTIAGHPGGEPETKKRLRWATDEMVRGV